MALTARGPLFFGQAGGTAGATDPVFVVFTLAHGLVEWLPASVAEVVLPGFKVVVEGDPVIKDKTFAFPQAVGFGDFFEVFEDAPAQMVYFFESEPDEVGGGFLATNPAGAEHGHFFVLLGIQMFFDVCGEVAEGFCVWVECPFKGADFDFEVVPGIDERHFGVTDEGVPVFGIDVRPYSASGIDAFHPEMNNFFFESYLHAAERNGWGLGLFVLEVG